MAELVDSRQLLVDRFVKYWSADATPEDIARYYANLKLADVVIGEITVDENGHFVADITVPSRGLEAPQQSWTPAPLATVVAGAVEATMEDVKKEIAESIFLVGGELYAVVTASDFHLSVIEDLLGFKFDEADMEHISGDNPDDETDLGVVMIDSKFAVGEVKVILAADSFEIPPTDIGQLGISPEEKQP